MIDATPVAQAIQTIVTTVLPGTPVYWTRARVPDPQPDEFVVIEPFGIIVNQSWTVNTHAQHQIQITSAARTAGRAGAMSETIFAAIPPTEYAVLAGQGLGAVGAHYVAAFRVQTHATT